ncbi:MAG: response regulator [Elusimicrobia bacterium]|nr:response regulator [Elusimicrobiota bacterium]
MNGSTRTILIADDDAAIRGVVSRGLAGGPYRINTAADGTAALESALADKPDLVLLDVNMPRHSGWEVLAELRGSPRTRRVPVIMLTARGSVADKVAGLESGADDYVAKPFDIKELRARVESVLRRDDSEHACHPLTRLPGCPAIAAEVGRRLRLGLPFAYVYADVDNFKAYNDVYGYVAGDRVIQATAGILEGCVLAAKDQSGFVGHVGGDDFVLVVDAAAAPHVVWQVTGNFDGCAPGFYDQAAVRRGFIETSDRFGATHRFPLMTLTMAVVTSEGRLFQGYEEIVQAAAGLKRYFKNRPANGKSQFVFDRRREVE